ncbi:hypothetical protein HOP52_09795 [Halomonas campisalis]|uniref:Uncharacterized protein n=1 Tax=Billgrantia campisalis TaxID=74661 RepID=A0ABS9P8T4_9GAMM|nr:hypothetical protein [Halomonas campisalis]MCG6658046.1 hypothetical protein [Halomonas campisalis]MDR5862712.1 hypothetical protein [Halomonas campisalis]
MALGNIFLIELLRQEVRDAEQELSNLRSSLRYSIGDMLLQALPLSWRSFRVLPKLWRLYRQYSGGRAPGTAAAHSLLKLPETALGAEHLLLGPTSAEGGAHAWATEDVELMALRLRADAPVASLTLRCLSASVVRQLARVQQQGGRIIWWPNPEISNAPELEAYVVALADECRSGDPF